MTNEQAKSLERNLLKKGNYKCFVVMRCWHPRAENVIKEVKEYNPEEIILLPLYPQYSASTSGSSIKEWNDLCKKENYKVKTKTICCYPTETNFIKSHANLIKKTVKNLNNKNFKLLFSAHGLPEKNIKKGDPYQWQVQQTVLSIMNGINGAEDHVLCYQSKVTPVKWLEPSTPDEIKKAVQDDVAIIIVPIAFVSDHSETLVELDIEYKNLAEEMGSKDYYRIEALNINEMFIEGLKDLVLESQEVRVTKNISAKICPKTFKECYHNINE